MVVSSKMWVPWNPGVNGRQGITLDIRTKKKSSAGGLAPTLCLLGVTGMWPSSQRSPDFSGNLGFASASMGRHGGVEFQTLRGLVPTRRLGRVGTSFGVTRALTFSSKSGLYLSFLSFFLRFYLFI